MAAWWGLSGGLFLGWGLGANDASNFFGTAVGARIISYRRACVLCSIAVIAGAVIGGQAGMGTLSELSGQTFATLLIASGAAALTTLLMTALSVPISTSQAVVGAIVGIGLATGQMQWRLLVKVVVCWVGTPVGAMIFSFFAYHLLGSLLSRVPMSMLSRDKILWSGLLVVGTYGSYALGANNVANATGIFSGQIDGVSDQQLALWGGLAIAFGVITYSKRVMLSLGSGIMPMDAFTSLVAVLAMSMTVHLFAIIGVPVSSSQAIVGAIIGIALIRRSGTLRLGALRHIFTGWLLTPVVSFLFATAGYAVYNGFCLKG